VHQISGNGLVIRSWGQTQWATKPTGHDPNPPINLEEASNITLGDVVVASVGTSTIQASGAVTLGTVVVAGVGTSTVQSSGAITLGAVVVDGSGSVGATTIQATEIGRAHV